MHPKEIKLLNPNHQYQSDENHSADENQPLNKIVDTLVYTSGAQFWQSAKP